MKNAPFLLSSLLALLAVVLSFVSFGASQTNNGLQSEFLKKQTEFQDLQQLVTLQNQEYQRQGEIINTGANLGQKVMQPILVEMGYVAAKKKNKKFAEVLNEQKFEKAIPSDDDLKKMDKAIQDSKAKAGGTAPASSAPSPQPSGAPALRPN